jgi:RHS repeat-associated protein
VNVPWQDFVVVPDVALIALDTRVTTVTANSTVMQVAQGSMQNDADGTRHVLVLTPSGTTAAMTMPDGSLQQLSVLHIRATEYTVGSNGPMAMPAALPPLSGYTYCVELSVDEAITAGATGVVFSQAVITYVENFLNFPVGTNVPVGFYDRTNGVWIPSPNGRIVKIVGVVGGLADVDTNGDNIADNGLGITSDERKNLASAFSVGQTLWRVPVTHFSPEDSNWPYTIPDDAKTPSESGAGPNPDEPLQDPQCSSGSIVECENRVLGESLPIIGTSFSLNYHSDRVPGQVATRTIRLSGASVPASLASIGLHLSVAGRNFDDNFPATPNQQTTFVWDRLDSYGRQTLGGQTLSVKIDYNYPTTYKDPGPLPSVFNSVGGVTLGANPTRQQIAVAQLFTTTIGEGLTDARGIGMGGWTLSGHHVYDPQARVVHLGNGSRRRAGSIARILTFIDVPSQSILFDVDVGPDGSQYIALPHGDLIVRIAPDGTQSIVAGNGVEGFSGDGGPATQAMLGDPTGVAVGRDGSLYIAEESNFRVRKVSPDGTISTVAGTGVAGFSGDGGSATQAKLTFAERVAVAPDSSLYILDGQRVRRVNNDGIINTVAGNGTVGFSGDGGLATAASLNASAVAVAPDGGFYIADFGNRRVRRVTPDGIIRTVVNYTSSLGQPVSIRPTRDGSVLIGVQFSSSRTPQVDLLRPDGSVVTIAGGGPSPIQQGIPATQANLVAMRGVALGPDGSVYIVRGDNSDQLLRIGPALPGFEGNQFPIVSADGSQMYIFDTDGRHLRTLNTLTGAVLVEFGYDGVGRLSQITEKTGGIDNVTTIQHDGNGNPTKIIGPFGQQTLLSVDANGFLASITNPAGEAVQLGSTVDGLLTSLTDARGKTSSFAYDTSGHLLHDGDPVGGTQDLVQTIDSSSSFTVTRTTGLSRTTSYKVENLVGNVQKRTITAPDGTQNLSQETIDAGATTLTNADGTVTNVQLGPDPRFGMQAPFAKSQTLTPPVGLATTYTANRTATLSNASDPLSLTSLTETTAINGRTTTTTYTQSTKTLLTASAANRTSSLTIDSLGRMVSNQVTGLNGASMTYDANGRLATLTRGSGPGARTLTFAYNPAGFVSTVTDPIGRMTQFNYDDAGRVTSKVFPDGRILSMSYDAAGNLATLTPPGRPAYSVTVSDRNEMTAFTPPTVAGSGPTSYTYNLDKQLTSLSLPDNRAVTLGYDSGGRRSTRNLISSGVTTGTDTYSYDSAGRVAGINAASGVDLAYSYDGLLTNQLSWTGLVAGNVGFTYDNSLRLASESVNGANTITFSYDNDDLLTGAGSLTITRDAQTGFATGTSLGTVTTTISYTGFAEVSSYSASTNGSAIFSNTYTRDKLGRITQKIETIGGVTSTYDYSYSTAGQLTGVSKDSVAVEAYGYDDNGNRTSTTLSGVLTNATFDDQDRILTFGMTTYNHNGAGDVQSKTASGQTTNYEYDQLGNLLSVTPQVGNAIAYVVDGQNRRVGKKINGVLVKGFLYKDQLRPAAETDATGAVVSRFVYAGSNVPVFMIKGGITFRIVSDHLGSVRLVVNTATGAIVQRMDYDSFGRVTLDTNPDFQPFGFAGGLYDPDIGLVRFGTRDYEPVTGRWTGKDIIGFAGRDTNLYRYVRNDPLNKLDSSGLSERDLEMIEATMEYSIAENFLAGERFPGSHTGTINNIIAGFQQMAEIAIGLVHDVQFTRFEGCVDQRNDLLRMLQELQRKGFISNDFSFVQATGHNYFLFEHNWIEGISVADNVIIAIDPWKGTIETQPLF